jgi:hypothetical protein
MEVRRVQDRDLVQLRIDDVVQAHHDRRILHVRSRRHARQVPPAVRLRGDRARTDRDQLVRATAVDHTIPHDPRHVRPGVARRSTDGLLPQRDQRIAVRASRVHRSTRCIAARRANLVIRRISRRKYGHAAIHQQRHAWRNRNRRDDKRIVRSVRHQLHGLARRAAAQRCLDIRGIRRRVQLARRLSASNAEVRLHLRAHRRKRRLGHRAAVASRQLRMRSRGHHAAHRRRHRGTHHQRTNPCGHRRERKRPGHQSESAPISCLTAWRHCMAYSVSLAVSRQTETLRSFPGPERSTIRTLSMLP